MSNFRKVKSESIVYRYLLIALLQSVALIGLSQNESLKFEHLSTTEGLSQSHVTCILQDHQGFMWFGTQSGLNKYDGYKFTVYINSPEDSTSLGHNFIRDLAEDSEGNIWIATAGGGLSVLDGKRKSFTNYKHSESRVSIASDYLANLTLDDSGDIWIATCRRRRQI